MSLIKEITAEKTTLLEQKIAPNNTDTLTIGIKNIGSIALETFTVEFQVEEDGEWYSWFNQGTNWTELTENSYIYTSLPIDPTKLQPNQKTAFNLQNLGGWYSVQLTASTLSGKTNIKLEIGGE